MGVTTRSAKGEPLTFEEMDENFNILAGIVGGGGQRVGDILLSADADTPDKYLPCDGRNYTKAGRYNAARTIGPLPQGDLVNIHDNAYFLESNSYIADIKIINGSFVMTCNSSRVVFGPNPYSTVVTESLGQTILDVAYNGSTRYVLVGAGVIKYIGSLVTTASSYSNATNPIPNSTLESVAYGNSKFVAAGSYDSTAASNCCYSSDGINWTKSPQGIGSNSRVLHVEFGAGNFVASMDNNSTDWMYYSADGITWTRCSGGLGQHTIRHIHYAAGAAEPAFIAASGEQIFRSTDGITFSIVASVEDGTAPSSTRAGSIMSNGSLICVRYDDEAIAATSDDSGKTWTLHTGIEGWITGGTTEGYEGKGAYFSTDNLWIRGRYRAQVGVSTTRAETYGYYGSIGSAFDDEQIYDLALTSRGKVIIVGGNSNGAQAKQSYSVDGVQFKRIHDTNSRNTIHRIAVGKNNFCVVTGGDKINSGTVIQQIRDYNTYTLPSGSGCICVEYNDVYSISFTDRGTWMAVTYASAPADGRILLSSDGINWVSQTTNNAFSSSVIPTSACCDGDMWYITTNTGKVFKFNHTTNGPVEVYSTSADFRDSLIHNGRLFVCGSSGKLMYSSNYTASSGVSFTNITSNTTGTMYKIIYSDTDSSANYRKGYYSVTGLGQVMYSATGIDGWVEKIDFGTKISYSIAAHRGFMCVGSEDGVYAATMGDVRNAVTMFNTPKLNLISMGTTVEDSFTYFVRVEA